MTNSPTFQDRATHWAVSTFGHDLAVKDKLERAQRFFEEACELAQSIGLSRKQAHAILDWKYDGTPGSIASEVGGTYLTLALLCEGYGLDMIRIADGTLDGCWDRKEQIKAKQKTKPRF